MFYEFPKIKTIDDVLPHIENHDDFFVKEKDNYTVINYNTMTSDTFRPFTGEDDIGNAIRRECRGLIFDNETREIIRRPFHKFFNIGEREETIELPKSSDFRIHLKMDGSMISPFLTSDGELHWGTKMGVTDISEECSEWIDSMDDIKYDVFVVGLLQFGFTPIFEWCARSNRVVIDHPKPTLTLLAIRNMYDGSYLKDLFDYAPSYIPVVDEVDSSVNINDILQRLDKETDNEGYVIKYNNGHMLKAKTEWYIALHKVKSDILFERNVVKLILEEKLDDIKPYLIDVDLERINCYEKDFWRVFNDMKRRILSRLAFCKGMERKKFAIEYADKFGVFVGHIFRNYESYIESEYGVASNDLHLALANMWLHNCGTNSKYDSFKNGFNISLEWG